MTERRVIGPSPFARALVMAALLVTGLAPAASLAAEAPPAPGCDAQSMLADPGRARAPDPACIAPDLERDQAYLVETARPGSTMLRQGLALAIARLHPTLVRRLAGAISEARPAGLPSAGIFSAYRPPAFGVGGFADKFNSLHTYGLAVDLLGIGRPGSTEARIWYDIAARHGIVCPYGAGSRREWNHCQLTSVKSIMAGDPLRGTVSPPGPIDLEAMFAMGDALVSETDAGATSPALQPALDEKFAGRAPGQRRPQGADGRGESIKTGHDPAEPGHETHRRVKSLADRTLHAAHGQSTRRIVAENVSGKSGPIKKYRTASLVKRASFAGDSKAVASNKHASARRVADNAHVDRVIKGVCHGC